jgi:anti-sigma factor RsiW
VTDEALHDGEAGEVAGDIEDAILARVSDYLDGALTPPERSEVAGKIASDATWKRAHDELAGTRNVLSGLRKAHAPPSFAEHVTETIHQRSAGRLFARKTLGDRVPFGVLLVIALAGLLVIGYVLWSSSTGSLKVERARNPAPAAGSSAVAPP